MKLVSFQVASPIGPVTRIGAVDANGAYVDLAAAWAGFATSLGATSDAATRLAASIFPPDMVDFIATGDVGLDEPLLSAELRVGSRSRGDQRDRGRDDESRCVSHDVSTKNVIRNRPSRPDTGWDDGKCK